MRSNVSVGLLGLALGCLPRGPEPTGDLVSPTRAAAGAELLRPVAGMPRRLLSWQERPDTDGSDLFVSDLSTTGRAGPLRPLAERIDLGVSRVCQAAPPITIDISGPAYACT